MPADAYARGATDSAVLEITIGRSWRDAVARHAGRRGARRRRSGRAADLRASSTREARRCAARAARPWRRQGRPRRHLGAQPLRVGRRPVSRRRTSAPSSSTSTRPTAGTSCEYALRQSGVALLVLARGFKGADYVESSPRRARRPGCASRCSSTTTGRNSWPRRPASTDDALEALRGDARLRRADQHPVHLGHDRLPQGRDALAPQHPQQRLLHRRDLRLHRGGPRLRPGAVLPLLRHGARQPRLRHARRLRGASRAERSTRPPTLEAVEAERCTSLYGVPTMFIAELEHPRFDEFDLSSLRTGDHGRRRPARSR